MSKYKVNHFSGVVNPFFSNKDHAYDRAMANVNYGIEFNQNPFYNNSRVCVILNAYNSGIITATSKNNVIHPAELVEMPDGSTRWKLRFAIDERYYGTPISDWWTRIYGSSPVVHGLSEEDMVYKIGKMPELYTEGDYRAYTKLHFGCYMTVRLRHGLYYGTLIAGRWQPNLSNNKNSTKDSHDDGPTWHDAIPKIPPLMSSPLVPEISNLNKGDFVLIFGDSQSQSSTKGGATIGKTLEDFLIKRGMNVKREGNQGKQPSFYYSGAGWAKISPELKKGPKLIIMTLGGNGTTSAVEMIEKVKKEAPSAKTIWIGAPPPAIDGTLYKHEKNFSPRQKKNAFLQLNISSKVDRFINPYGVTSFTQGYKCGGKCDGIHVPGNIAITFLANSGLMEVGK